MRALIIGAVESTRIAARCLADARDWTLAAIVTLDSGLAGRHSDFVDLAPDAASAGAHLIRCENANSDEVLRAIADVASDYLFVIGWSQLCGERLLQTSPGRVIGYHPAPLPRLRGRGVIPWTILLEEPITAGTLFLIDAGTDTGPILAQRFFHVAPDETAATLYGRHMEVLGEMLPGLLVRLADGSARAEAQDDRYASWAARRRPEDAEIAWRDGAEAICRLVRACGRPYPGAFTFCGTDRIGIAAAEVVTLAGHRAAMIGQIVERTACDFTVRCGDGRGLRVHEWQRERPLPPPLHALLGRRSGLVG